MDVRKPLEPAHLNLDAVVCPEFHLRSGAGLMEGLFDYFQVKEGRSQGDKAQKTPLPVV
jgi:hypothetical protein